MKMRYQITCDNCGRQFLVNGEPGKTVKCMCPGCGGTIKVTLPDIPVPSTGVRPSDAHVVRKKKSSHNPANPILLGIIIGVTVLAVLAVVLFVSSRFGNRPVIPVNRGYSVDTMAVPQEYIYEEPDTEIVPESLPDTVATDTVIKGEIDIKHEKPVEIEESDSVAI